MLKVSEKIWQTLRGGEKLSTELVKTRENGVIVRKRDRRKNTTKKSVNVDGRKTRSIMYGVSD